LLALDLASLDPLGAIGASLAFDALRTLDAFGAALHALGTFDALRTLRTLNTLGKALLALHTLRALNALGTVGARLTALDGLGPLATGAALNFGGLAAFAVRLGACRGDDRQRGNAGGEKYPGHHEILLFARYNGP
jgi:hypothetical protein